MPLCLPMRALRLFAVLCFTRYVECTVMKLQPLRDVQLWMVRYMPSLRRLLGGAEIKSTTFPIWRLFTISAARTSRNHWMHFFSQWLRISSQSSSCLYLLLFQNFLLLFFVPLDILKCIHSSCLLAYVKGP